MHADEHQHFLFRDLRAERVEDVVREQARRRQKRAVRGTDDRGDQCAEEDRQEDRVDAAENLNSHAREHLVLKVGAERFRRNAEFREDQLCGESDRDRNHADDDVENA